jgi:hypothetical protein
MDKWQAQYNFWSSFGVPAFEESAVPDSGKVSFPYITYQAMSAPFGNVTYPNANIWSRSTSWEEADAISDLIENTIKNGGAVVPYDGGIIWVVSEDTFSRSLADPSDNMIRRKLLSVALHFC